MKSLSVGNVVSAGLKIYRANFKNYYYLAFIAALWSWVPIYGWAKYVANLGLISRLAFNEITENPETLSEARRYIKPRMWSFLGASLLVFLKLFLAYLGGAIVVAIFFGVIIGGLSAVLGTAGSIIAIPLVIIVLIAFVVYFIRIISRYFIFDLPLAVEDNVNASGSVNRSVELTKGFLGNIQLIVFITGLISFPLWGIAIVLQLIPEFVKNSELAIPNSLVFIVSLIVSSATAAFIAPFWQTTKAVVYYDLRVRREGLGMELRDQ
jgi:hypothetical protein